MRINYAAWQFLLPYVSGEIVDFDSLANAAWKTDANKHLLETVAEVCMQAGKMCGGNKLTSFTLIMVQLFFIMLP